MSRQPWASLETFWAFIYKKRKRKSEVESNQFCKRLAGTLHLWELWVCASQSEGMAINHFPLVTDSRPHWLPSMTPRVNVKYCASSLVWRLARSLRHRHRPPQNEDWLWKMWTGQECTHSYFSCRFYYFLVGLGPDRLGVSTGKTVMAWGILLLLLLFVVQKCHPRLGSNLQSEQWETWVLYAQLKPTVFIYSDCETESWFGWLHNTVTASQKKHVRKDALNYVTYLTSHRGSRR